MEGLISQLLRVVKLEPAIFDEVVENPATLGRSRWVVILFAMAAGTGMFFKAGAVAVNIGLVTTLISWYVWAFSTYYVGAYIFAEQGAPKDRRAVMRVMAFSTAPGILRIFGVIPNAFGVVFLITGLWMVAASAIGVQQALGLPTIRKAVAISMGCWLLSTLLQAAILVAALSAFGIKSG